jgi:hypothetical protein
LKVANCAKRVKNAAEAACAGLAFPFEPQNWQIGAFVFEPVWMWDQAAPTKEKHVFFDIWSESEKGTIMRETSPLKTAAK